MKAVLRVLTLPIRVVITVLIWICALLIRISGKIFGLAAGLLILLCLAVLTYSTKNALMVFAMAFLISPIGLPTAAVGLLSLLNGAISYCRFFNYNNISSMSFKPIHSTILNIETQLRFIAEAGLAGQ